MSVDPNASNTPQPSSEPTIPNLLNSLRAGRGGRGGRGRGGVRSGAAAGNLARDSPIQATDTDAAVSRLSAVELGYLHDPFASIFVSGTDGPSPRRLPIINRGEFNINKGMNNRGRDGLIPDRNIYSDNFHRFLCQCLC